ncbi:hypothetical protein [Methylobacterium radiotolerans]|uniref:Uncharacterized protein n=1 Tax=Methylobacterium radiotolerans (strain ATCC 27329 / DSM 1819 / JCM 2831 / NBRC 15690 / NCIMB 10815 / 0-1) TaxID=426355 RepID=B1M1X8_METRJ|nr:hypothetical protein [Methylobacterium radiotolerans]ACB23163.1 hypothetical protein Mrad2831_1154 [Methylobacterium radiotolerans JCM 2831]GEN00367.1 hypothetical protein MRA01_49060 [Methylobacterium radiotolerans]
MVRPPARLPGRWPGWRDHARDLALVPTAAVTARAIQVFSADPTGLILDLPGHPALAFCAVPDGRDGMPILLGLLTLGPGLGLIGPVGLNRPHSWLGPILGAGLAAFWLQRFVLHVPGCTP